MASHVSDGSAEIPGEEMSAALEGILNGINQRVGGREPNMQQWTCQDGYLVGYTTERFGTYRSPFARLDDEPSGAGKFGFFVYKPVGKGARSGKAEE